VHRHAGKPDNAEDAYRQSLAIKVQLGDVHGQASTLGELGNLYQRLGRLEEAAAQFRRSADYYVTLGNTNLEGFARYSLARTLSGLHRWEGARQEIHRAIECDEPFGHAAEPWKTWSVLGNIETGAGRADLAAQARFRARECYLAYRRDGGENHDGDGRIALAVTELLLAGDTAAVMAKLDSMLAGSSIPDHLRPFVVALRAIAAGSRDRSLADGAALDHTMAAEVLLLIDKLEAAAAGAA
jgi:tetratricopeptide (TPR) repeat protein